MAASENGLMSNATGPSVAYRIASSKNGVPVLLGVDAHRVAPRHRSRWSSEHGNSAKNSCGATTSWSSGAASAHVTGQLVGDQFGGDARRRGLDQVLGDLAHEDVAMRTDENTAEHGASTVPAAA